MTDDFATKIEELDELGIAEWSFMQLVRTLLHSTLPSSSVSQQNREGYDRALKELAAGAQGLHELISKVEDPDSRTDAFGDAEFLISGALRIGAYDREALFNLSRTEKALNTKAHKDAERKAKEIAFLRSHLGQRSGLKHEKLLEELLGSTDSKKAFNAAAKAAGMNCFSKSTLRRRLLEMKNSD